jgi:hypothetical protein
MMKFKYHIFLLALLIGFAASAKVTFEISPIQNVIAGRHFAIQYVLSAANEKDFNSVPSLSAPEIQGCQRLSDPQVSTSYQQSIINGRSESAVKVIYTIHYTAGAKGKTSVPPISLTVGGKTFKTAKRDFEILPDTGNNSQQAQSGNSQAQRQQSAASQGTGQKVTANDLMVHISFSKANTYEQEAVIATIKLYVAYDRQFEIDGSSFRIIKQPIFEGFLSEDLPTANTSKVENYNGSNYETVELKKVLLFPQKAGQLRVQSGEYEISIVEFERVRTMFGYQRRQIPGKITTRPNTASLQVIALPEPKPANFHGAVGNYTISAELTPDIVKTNEAATYSLIVKGTGNVKYLTEPEIAFPSSFDKYTAKTDINAKFNGTTYAGTYRIDYPFVAQEVGKFDIPAYTFTYFNPSTKKYETLETRAFNINVARGAAVSTVGAQKQVQAMNDILHIHTLPANPSAIGKPVFNSTIYRLLYLAIALALAIIVFAYRRHAKKLADVTGRRLARANRVATRRFKVASKYMKAHDNEHFYEELARALKGYIGDKLGIAPSQLISDTIMEKLTIYGASEETATAVIDVLNDCEMARFTPSQSDEAMNDIYNRASSAIKAIEDVKTK